ncbi:hypothetical protein Dsin_013029 [Dipteronia sinensis]|uniref:Cyclic nucleotide-binding domain-containing protein n=1 Tax=Dipteronia sinensis TaxID=43782 RepID=A0AAE0AKF2_9ROSI|nr:hypothetical protein Dsin_013029 [Dipteronia sinensis]
MHYGEGSGYSLVKRACAVVWKLWPYHIFDLLAILPLPQVVIIIIIATMRGSKFLIAMNLLKYFVFFQYVPRVIRIYPLFRKATRTLGIFAEASWSKAAFNFLLYMVFGALWYILAIEREIECWKNACKSHTGCRHDSIDCQKSSENHVFFNDFCSTETHNTNIYDFGIFRDTVRSGIVGNRNFLKKVMYCFRWGLQSLRFVYDINRELLFRTKPCNKYRCLGKHLYNFHYCLQRADIYVQVETIRSEEMKLKLRDIERWMPFKKLPVRLQEEVKRYQQHVWRETKGVDVENLLNNLPKDLRRDIMRHLCLHMLKKVSIFEIMDEQYLNEMCDRLKPVLHRHGSYIIRKGDKIEGMHFITGGRVRSKIGFFYCVPVEFCGEELALWALDSRSSSNPPVSIRSVEACTDVEGFALMADDVKCVVSSFMQNLTNAEQLCHVFKQTWAAYAIQAAWHSFSENKHKKSLSSSTSTINSSRFAATVIHAIRHNAAAKYSNTVAEGTNHASPEACGA